MLFKAHAPLAQLDRVFGYEPKGQGFESLAARQTKPCKLMFARFFLLLRIKY